MSTGRIERLVGRAEAERRAELAAARVADRALDEGLADVAYATMDSPIGELLLAVTPRGLAALVFESWDLDAWLERFARELSPRVVAAARATDAARKELDEYFGGARRRFDVGVDRRLMSPFVRKVMGATSRVSYGHVATYGSIAAEIGRPSAARAVGAALGANPVPVVLPCHRIVGAGGRLTGYGGGLPRKEFLLRLEGALPGSLPGVT
jgi:methylated-DNA-[protein]-cysteine S-methyltransferase